MSSDHPNLPPPATGDAPAPGVARSPETGAPNYATMAKPSLFAQYFWFVLKNVIGWLLILAAFVAGPFVPGPGGIPLFLIGFALITFPGKRRLTAGILHGKPVPPNSRGFRWTVAAVALLLPGAAMWYAIYKGWLPRYETNGRGFIYGGVYVVSAVLVWWVGLRSNPLINKILRGMPMVRRKMRPWLRRRGIDLLPPRRRRRRMTPHGPMVRDPDEEILEIHERHRTRFSWIWEKGKPWARRAVGLAITVAIFVWILRPLVQNWDRVRERAGDIDWAHFVMSVGMFALFLFAFRAMVWRQILAWLGHRLPVAAATRIWSTSELARYLPGMIWQVVGRVYLVKPYGVRGSVCSASQVIELVVFLLANLLVAVACLVYFGIWRFEGAVEVWLKAAMALVPVLLIVLHPRVLYGLLNRIMRRLGKPPLTQRMGFAHLFGVLAWSVIGVLFQSLAIWFLVARPLELPLVKWWMVAGSYSLAWCAGFLAFWAPGGIGVRELVFMAAMRVALPASVRADFEGAALPAFLAFLSVLLRLWATCGELVLSAIAYALDFRGALGRVEVMPRQTPPPPPPPRELAEAVAEKS